MVALRLSLDDLDASESLSEAIRRAGDLTPLMEQIGTVLEFSVSERFKNSVGPGGTPWPVSHRAREVGGKTLVDKGHLRDSISKEASARSVVIGTNMPYAHVHQFGALIEPKTVDEDATAKLAFRLPNGQFVMVDQVEIPARPFLGFDDADAADIADTVFAYFNGAFS